VALCPFFTFSPTLKDLDEEIDVEKTFFLSLEQLETTPEDFSEFYYEE
jgi:hypothetical protein